MLCGKDGTPLQFSLAAPDAEGERHGGTQCPIVEEGEMIRKRHLNMDQQGSLGDRPGPQVAGCPHDFLVPVQEHEPRTKRREQSGHLIAWAPRHEIATYGGPVANANVSDLP